MSKYEYNGKISKDHQEGDFTIWTWQQCSVLCSWAEPIGIHLSECSLGYGNDRETDSYYGDQTCTDVISALFYSMSDLE